MGHGGRHTQILPHLQGIHFPVNTAASAYPVVNLCSGEPLVYPESEIVYQTVRPAASRGQQLYRNIVY
jgi:hypothetical protein